MGKKNGARTIPFGAAHAYMPYTRECLLSPVLKLKQNVENRQSLITSKLLRRKSRFLDIYLDIVFRYKFLDVVNFHAPLRTKRARRKKHPGSIQD